MATVIERKNHIYNKKPAKKAKGSHPKAQENFRDGKTSSLKRSDLFCEHYKIIGHSKEKCLDNSSGTLSNEVVKERSKSTNRDHTMGNDSTKLSLVFHSNSSLSLMVMV